MNPPVTITARAMLTALLFLVTLFSVSAVIGTWEQAGYDATNRGQCANCNGDFSDGVNHSTNVSVGWAYHTPIVADVDADGGREVFMVSGGYLQVYDADLALIDEMALPVTLRGDLVVVPGGVASWYYGASNKHYVVKYGFNGALSSSCVSANITNLGGVDATTGGLSCVGDICAWVIGTAASNTWFGAMVNMSDCHADTRVLAAPKSIDKLGSTRHPSMADINRDGFLDVVIALDTNENSNYGITAYNANATPWTVIGTKDDVSMTPSQPLIYNLDGVGDTEIIMAYGNGRNDLQLTAYKPDLTRFSSAWSVNISGQNMNAVSPAVFNDGLTNNYICGMGADVAAANGSYILCLGTSGTDKQSAHLVDAQLVATTSLTYMSLVSADLDDDGADELLTSRGVLQGPGEGMTAFLSLGGAEDAQTVVADLSDDEAADIVSLDGSVLKAYYGNGLTPAQECILSNYVPVISQTYRDTGNPVCVGENVTFQVTIDDPFDEVRLLVDCEGDGITDYASAYTNGSVISHECAYPGPGSFTALLTVNDDCLATDSATSGVIVSTGVCNDQGEGAGSTGAPIGGASNSVGDFVDSISDATGMSSLFLWLLLMLGVGGVVILAAIKAGWNGAAMSVLLVFAEGGMVMLGVILGFLGVGVVIVLSLLCIVGLVVWVKDAFGGGGY